MQYSTSSDIPRFDKLTELRSGTLQFAEWYYGPQERFLASSKLAISPNKKWLKSGVFVVAYQKIKESRIQRRFNRLDRYYRREAVDVFSINGDFNALLSEEKKKTLSYGFEVTYNDVLSRSEGRTLAVSGNLEVGVSGNFKVQSRFPDGGSNYTSSAAYASYRQNLSPKSTLNTGLRLTSTWLAARWIDPSFIVLPKSNISLKNSALTGTIGYVYKPTAGWQINAVLSSGFRSPNIDDVGKIREKNGNVTVPNIDLKPEYAYNAEIGIQKYILQKTFRFDLNAYYTLLDNYITREDFMLNGQSTILYSGELGNTVSNVNKGTAYITGFTLGYQGKINRIWGLSGFVTYTKGFTYDTQLPLSSIPPLFGEFEGSYKMANLEISGSLRFNARKKISEYNLVEGIDNHPQTPVVDPNATDPIDKYFGSPSWMTVGVNGRYRINKSLSLRAVLSNIFDVHYKEFASGVSAPGRSFSIAVHVRF